jgi:RNA polymerase sigma-70 factor (ECF subfamily)
VGATGAEVDALLDAAAASWPGVQIPSPVFRSFVAGKVQGALDERTLGVLRLGDLYLACACAAGNDRALAAFRDRFGAAIRHTVTRAAPRALADELVQQVLAKLLAGAPPAIATYGGVGKLSTWVQVVARHEARSRLRAARRERGEARDDVEQLMDHAIQAEDVALLDLKQRYRDELKHAFAEALGALSPHERNLLRHECLEELTREEIAERYGVSLSTVARWRAACRQRLRSATLAALGGRLGVGGDELHSVLRSIDSQLDVSLSRLLKT